MPLEFPQFGNLWPYVEAAVPPELAGLPIDAFFSDPRNSSIKAAQWVYPADPEAAPRASYAVRIRCADGQGELARWNSDTGEWDVVAEFPVPGSREDCAIVQLNGIVLGGVSTIDGLKDRLRSLLQAELSEMKVYRLTSKVLSVMSIIVLFYSVRSGVESRAYEPFLLIFALAFGIGMIAVGLRSRCKIIGELGLARVREQFQFEFRAADHAPLSINNVSSILQEQDRKREEEAVIFGFLLLLCFVYFISPLVVVGVIVALVITTMMTGDSGMLRIIGIAYERSELRLEQAVLSLRAGHDSLSPPALRKAKKEVLRDRIRRYGNTLAIARNTQGRFRRNQDIAFVVAFVVIFSAYAFPIAAGFQLMAVTNADSLISTSLFSVAPVIVLLSISKSTVAMAQIANRQIRALSR